MENCLTSLDFAQLQTQGVNLRWVRLNSNDIRTLDFNSFIEREKIKEKLDYFMAQPNRYIYEILQERNKTIAIRVCQNNSNKMLISLLLEVMPSVDQSLFQRFLISDTISKAVGHNIDLVKFDGSAITSSLKKELIEMGFIEFNGEFVKFCFSRSLNREEVLSLISELYSEATTKYQNMSDLTLEKSCSPIALEGTNQSYYLIPIRPVYALSHIDSGQSVDDVFEENPNILLRWYNVYYSGANLPQNPGRILWYVTSGIKQIIAVSRLDEVSIGKPSELFNKYRNSGILELNDINQMFKGGPLKKLRAFKFSQTILFREPISLVDVKSIYTKNGVGLYLGSPTTLSPELFHDLFQHGFPN